MSFENSHLMLHEALLKTISIGLSPEHFADDDACIINGHDIFLPGPYRYNFLESLLRKIDDQLCTQEFGLNDESLDLDARCSKLGKAVELMGLAPAGQGATLVTGGDRGQAAKNFMEMVGSTAAAAHALDQAENEQEILNQGENCRTLISEICKRASAKASGGLFQLGVHGIIALPPHISSEISRRRAENGNSVSKALRSFIF
jgi:hypothetical protein